MTPSGASGDAVGRLVEGLRAGGYEVGVQSAGHGDAWILTIVTPWSTRPQELVVQLRPLRRSRLPWRRALSRIVASSMFASRRLPRREDAFTLVLGVDHVRDVFVGWPSKLDPDAPVQAPTFAEVPLTALERASDGQLAPFEPRRGRGFGLAFPPERFDAYLTELYGPQVRISGRISGPISGQIALGSHSAQIEAPPPPEAPARLGDAAPPPDEEEVRRRFPFHLPPERRRLIETGFAPADAPDVSVSSWQPLAPGGSYYFFFAVGGVRGSTIERDPDAAMLPALERATLVVRVLCFADEVELIGDTRGTIELAPGREPRVGVRAASVSDTDEAHARTLFFPVRMPPCEGRFHLRCNVYLGSTVVQSRLVSCQVGGVGAPDRPALASDLDYALTDELALERLADVPEHDLSLLVNGIGSSHQFRFFSASGDQELSADATIEAVAIQELVTTARAAFRRVAWGDEDPWNGDPDVYCYAGDAEPSFEEDLILLARRGHDLYTAIVGRFDDEGDEERLARIGDRLRRVQIVTTSSNLYVPAALFYDHRLETSPGTDTAGDYRLCDAFAELLAADGSAAGLACFQAGCAQREHPYRVCPSGFWGFRHELGWPTRVDESRTQAVGTDPPRIVVGVSTDEAFELRDDHVRRLLDLVGANEAGALARSRDALTPLLKRDDASLVYLYCHGGVNGANVPFVELGAPQRDNGITTTYLKDEQIRWRRTRPLVFVNGCHTTALEPRQLLGLVDGFVGRAKALGVIGTELTIFEPLACAFADAALPGYLDGSQTIGEAVRHARLELLSRRNPLGLVYVPFVAAATRLVP